MVDKTISSPGNGKMPEQAVGTQRDLKSWWKQFKRRPRTDRKQSPLVFGVPLVTSIKYANVAISLIDEHGNPFIYGYVPIVVGKCGTDVKDIFRLKGSPQGVKELQIIFNSPDRYGKGVDWTPYTVHDAADILLRYLISLPEPIVPLDFYERFREPLRSYLPQLGGNISIQIQISGASIHGKYISMYQRMVTELPPLNRQLLLYLLDLLAVFASRSAINEMGAVQLSAIFQPGLLSHPTHSLSPEETRLSQDVLIFLIDNQDSFLIGMSGTAADEETLKEVQSNPPAQQISTSSTGIATSEDVSSSTNAASDNQDKSLTVLSSAGEDTMKEVQSSPQVQQSSISNLQIPTSETIYPGNITANGVDLNNITPSKKSRSLPSSHPPKISGSSDLIDYFKLDVIFDPTDSKTTIETTETSDRAQGRRQVRVIKRWKQIKNIGRGSFGKVWVESDQGDPTNRRAVKEISKDGGTNTSALVVDYTRELVALGRLSKRLDVFVNFYGWFENEFSVYLIMEYFDHGDLGKFIARGVTEQHAQIIGKQLLEGLEILHAQNWAHRDLKPANIFVVSPSPNWWVKIGDFGISRRLQEDDETRTSVGTWVYTAPEIKGFFPLFEDGDDTDSGTDNEPHRYKYDVAVDMWSLGCVLYQVLTQTLPFPNDTSLKKFCRRKRPSAFPIGPLCVHNVSQEGCDFIQRLLRIQPSERLTARAALQTDWIVKADDP